MLKRGQKRKFPASEEESESDFHLRNFQSTVRRRESMRIRKNALNATDGADPMAVEKQLKDRVAVEMNLIEGTAKFILACKNKTQVIREIERVHTSLDIVEL